MADHIKHGQYITELGTRFSAYKQITAPQIGAFGGEDMDGADFSLGWSFLTEPFLMVEHAHKHDFGQILFFFGGDPNNVGEFEAEVEMHLGENEEKNIITYPACVYIPAGLVHSPLNIKKVTKPIVFIDVTLSPGGSVRPLPEASRRDA